MIICLYCNPSLLVWITPVWWSVDVRTDYVQIEKNMKLEIYCFVFWFLHSHAYLGMLLSLGNSCRQVLQISCDKETLSKHFAWSRQIILELIFGNSSGRKKVSVSCRNNPGKSKTNELLCHKTPWNLPLFKDSGNELLFSRGKRDNFFPPSSWKKNCDENSTWKRLISHELSYWKTEKAFCTIQEIPGKRNTF